MKIKALILKRNGRQVASFKSELGAWNWLHQKHGLSIKWLFKHEGYTAYFETYCGNQLKYKV